MALCLVVPFFPAGMISQGYVSIHAFFFRLIIHQLVHYSFTQMKLLKHFVCVHKSWVPCLRKHSLDVIKGRV